MFDKDNWASRENAAWIYGIIIGWPEGFHDTLARKFKWDQEKIDLMKRLHIDFLARRDVQLEMEKPDATN